MNNKIKQRILSVLTQEDIDSLPIIHSPHEGYSYLQDIIDSVIHTNEISMKYKDELWHYITAGLHEEALESSKNMCINLYCSMWNMIKLILMCEVFIGVMEDIIENAQDIKD